jgi:hypothetical protein
MNRILFIVIALGLAGCGTARTIVLEPASTQDTYRNVQIVPQSPTVDVPMEVTQLFESELATRLYDSGAFENGTGLQLYYTFVSHDEGSRMARWFWGGIGNAGEGSIVVMVRYADPQGRELARTHVEGRIGSGWFGGSTKDAIKKAAQDVGDYTARNFKVQ